MVLNSQQLNNSETDNSAGDSSLKDTTCTIGTTHMTPQS